MSIYEKLGVTIAINAKGPATRLSGGIMRNEVSAAMADASRHCVDIAELQAAASHVIADLTGADAGYIASGASALPPQHASRVLIHRAWHASLTQKASRMK